MITGDGATYAGSVRDGWVRLQRHFRTSVFRAGTTNLIRFRQPSQAGDEEKQPYPVYDSSKSPFDQDPERSDKRHNAKSIGEEMDGLQAETVRFHEYTAVAKKICSVLLAPMPIAVMAQYGIQQTQRSSDPAADRLELHGNGLLTLLVSPGPMAFFLAGLASTVLLGFLWLNRRAADKRGMLLLGVASGPALVGFASGLDLLVIVLCLLPASFYATIVCNDVVVV